MKTKEQIQNMLAERYKRRASSTLEALTDRAEIKLLEEVLRDGEEVVSQRVDPFGVSGITNQRSGIY